jgi:hypothetical protein
VSFDGRLRRLEESGRSGVCPECGLSPKDKGYMIMLDEERPEASFQGDPGERCGRCGRFLYVVLHVVYDSPPSYRRGEGALLD